MNSETFGRSCEWWYGQGRLQLKEGNLLEAVSSFSQALLANPSNCYSRLARGLTFQQLSQTDDAIQDFSCLVDKYQSWPGIHLAYYNRAVCFETLEKFDDCIADCNMALKFNPTYLDALYQRGIAQIKLEQWTLALNDMHAIIESENPLADAFLTRGKIWYEQEHWDRAVEDISSYLQYGHTSNNDWRPYFIRGVALTELKEFEHAIKDLSVAARLDPSNGYVLLRRSHAYELLGDTAKSRLDFENGSALIHPDE